MVSRRRVLLGAAAGTVAAAGTAAGLVEAEVLPGRGPVHRALGLDGPETPLPDIEGGPAAGGGFRSSAMGGETVRWRVGYPPGMVTTARLPVVVALHARGEDHSWPFATLGIDRYLAKVTLVGTQPFAVASVDGGRSSYWHRRAGGKDPVRMIRTELLPMLAERGLQTARIGLIGWSMGGYGALLAAGDHPGRVAAVAAISPTLWRRAGDAPGAAFDSAADFRRNDVFTRLDALRRVQVRVDCGDVDPFVDTVRAFRKELRPRPGGGITEGGHDKYYWRRAMPGALGFLGDALVDNP